jgi:glycosyltransferase involved in cell wall biosynthesis
LRLAQKLHIYQSAALTIPPARPNESCFQVCILAHLREVKDPLRLAYAVRELPPSSRIQVKHAGAMIDPEFASQLETELARNPRYQWLGPLGHDDAMDLLAHSHMLVLTSRLEGGANVISEVIALSVPVISTLIPGSVGVLGPDYPGYFPVGDSAALRAQLQKAESDDGFVSSRPRMAGSRCAAPLNRSNSDLIELGAIARHWFEVMRNCGDEVRELLHDGCPGCLFRRRAVWLRQCLLSTSSKLGRRAAAKIKLRP